MNTKRIFAAVAALIAAVSLSACSTINDAIDSLGDTTSDTSTTSINQDGDYFTITGKAKVEHKVAAGKTGYCPLDKLGRAVCAYGSLTASLYAKEKAEDRAAITVNPAGWPKKNDKVTIPALDGVKGSKSYKGWMWNRSHLLADSLGGEPTKQNLVTGTRTQNVGSAQVSGEYGGGMAHTEVIARNYLANQKNDSCPLYYAAKPNYKGLELLPRTVTVDIKSCDGKINERVEVDNTANGFSINYKNADTVAN